MWSSICGVSDRRKDLVKLQAGEYVALSKVETVLKLCNLVDNICAYADSTKLFPVCLIVPNDKCLVALAHTLGITVAIDQWTQLCDNMDVEKAVLKELQVQGRKGVSQRRVGSGRVGSGRVGSGRVGSGRVGSGRVGSGRVGSGRVGSGRVGSGRVKYLYYSCSIQYNTWIFEMSSTCILLLKLFQCSILILKFQILVLEFVYSL